MTELQWLFAILTALYAWECLCWIRRGGVAFCSVSERRWRLQHPTSAAGNHRGGFVITMPFPPLGCVFLANQIPFSLGPDGVLFFVSTTMNPGWRPAQSGRFLNWEEAQRLRLDGRKLFLGKKNIFTSTTTTVAHHLFNLLSTLTKLPADKRASAIKQVLRDTMDTKRIVKLREEFRVRTRVIRLLCNVLFVHVFIVAPILIVTIGIQAAWLCLVIVMFLLTFSIATLFHCAHRALYPCAKDERFTHTLTTAFAAATSVRAHDIISRPLLENFHPLAVAKVLLDESQFCSFARKVLLDLRHPILPPCLNPQPQAMATELFYRRAGVEMVESWLSENGVALDDLCRPPKPMDKSSLAYCPRCEAQFTSTDHPCSDCGGITLVAFCHQKQ